MVSDLLPLDRPRRSPSAHTTCATRPFRSGWMPVSRRPRSPSGPGTAWMSSSGSTPSASTAKMRLRGYASKLRWHRRRPSESRTWP